MLGKPKTPAPAAETPTKISSIIGPGAIFDGNLNTPETTRVDGTINGNCNCEQNLILGPDGSIKGNIVAQNVIISGKVEGDIYARGKLELYPTGRLVGNISAKSLVIDENAYFDGRCSMTSSAPALPPSSEKGTGIPEIKYSENNKDENQK